MKKSELLELLKDVEDDADINETIQGIEGLIKPFDLSKITLEQYKEILENNEVIKGYNTSTLDSVRSKAVETYKNGKGKEAIKKAMPDIKLKRVSERDFKENPELIIDECVKWIEENYVM